MYSLPSQVVIPVDATKAVEKPRYAGRIFLTKMLLGNLSNGCCKPSLN
jgi:hypothetical protein